MKIAMTGIVAAALLSGTASAQQTSPAQNEPATRTSSQTKTNESTANANPRFAPGTVIPVELTKSVDAKKARSGDGVEARVTQDLKSGNGQIIVPKDTKVVGRVTEAQPRNKEQKESQVGIIFDRAEIKGRNEVTMPMSIQAIIAPAALGGGSANNAASSSQASDTAPGGSMPSSNAGSRTIGNGAGSPSTVSPPATGGEAPATSQAQTIPHEQITANTKGVVGISNLKLSSPADSKNGSVVSSEKSNVKLESGTFMLLRVNQ